MVSLICIIPKIMISYCIGRKFKTKWNIVVYTICNIVLTDFLYHILFYLHTPSQRDKDSIAMWAVLSFIFYSFLFIPPGLIGTQIGNIVKRNSMRKKHG